MTKSPLARLVPQLGRTGRASRWRRTHGRPRVWAHRGDSAHAPENTMRAFDQACAAGADGLEFDVRFDGDRNVVVFHDAELERLTGERGRMAELSATRREALRVGGEPIPTLADVLHAFDVELNVELKVDRVGRGAALVDATARVIRDAGRVDQIVVSSFDPIALVQFHRRLPEVSLAHLFAEDQALVLRRGWMGRVVGASLVHPQNTLCTARSVEAWHRSGLPVNVWTVDAPAELERLAALGVDGVFTNDPAQALRVLNAIS